ncbi:restriction endonuclease [Paracoccaceae bacterium GXU_MW_L88]
MSKEESPCAMAALCRVAGPKEMTNEIKHTQNPVETARSYRPPAQSRATRVPSARSKASGRSMIAVQTPAEAHPRYMFCESKLEQRALYLLLARPETLNIVEQPAPVAYTRADGRKRNHVFDFLLTQRCGHRIAIEVKPWAIAERTDLRQELQLVRAAMPLSFAHEIVLITDRSFTRAAAQNAERLHAFRRTADPEADATITALLADLTTQTKIAELALQSGLEGRGFRAVFRAIYAGRARTLTPGAILPSSTIIAEGRA